MKRIYYTLITASIIGAPLLRAEDNAAVDDASSTNLFDLPTKTF